MPTRLLTVFSSGFFAMKTWDLLVASNEDRPPPAAYAAFLLNPCLLVFRRRDAEPAVPAAENVGRLAAGLAKLGLGYLTLEGFGVLDWEAQSFWAEHCVKALGFFVCLLGLFQAIAAVWRLFGEVAREPHENALLPHSPAELWRRYNRIVHQFLLEDVFKPSGGRRRPLRGVMAAFLVSGMLHEYLFSWLAGRLQGLQLGFFLLQGAAVALTVRVKPRGLRRIAWAAATLAFNLATSVLFFASFDEVLPFYVNDPPAWLTPGR
jgi:hypothetical protein